MCFGQGQGEASLSGWIGAPLSPNVPFTSPARHPCPLLPSAIGSGCHTLSPPPFSTFGRLGLPLPPTVHLPPDPPHGFAELNCERG